jgi:mono/diheme cytochrome c family protein
MNKDAKQNLSNDVEPTVRVGGMVYLPMWLTGLLGLLVFWGFNYVGATGGNDSDLVYEPYLSTNQLAEFLPKDERARLMKIGQLQYGNLCAGCHQPSGMGNVGQAPPLAGSEWVLGGPNRLVRIPQNGVTGAIKVKGQEWNMTSMLGFAGQAQLSDEQLAGLVTFIRNSFGNAAPMVTPEEVAKVRASILKDKKDGQYTADELLKIPEAIP